jgi:hypothetical protein
MELHERSDIDCRSGLDATFMLLERQQQAGAMFTLGKGSGAGHE